MDSKVIPLKVPGAQRVQLNEFDQQLQSILQCMEFLQVTATTLLEETSQSSGHRSLSAKEREFYAKELPLVKTDVEEALAQLKALLGRVERDPAERPSA
ncbi:MAG: hypothetical protein AAGF33_01710 [Pseudomonadota bacterium]